MNILSPLTNRIPPPIPSQRFPHIKRILIILVIRHHPPVNRISHLSIQLLRNHVLSSDKQIYKPRIMGITLLFQCRREECRVTESSRRGRDGEGGYVTVPGEVIGVWIRFWVEGFDWGGIWGGFCFSKDCRVVSLSTETHIVAERQYRGE